MTDSMREETSEYDEDDLSSLLDLSMSDSEI